MLDDDEAHQNGCWVKSLKNHGDLHTGEVKRDVRVGDVMLKKFNGLAFNPRIQWLCGADVNETSI